MRKIVAFLVLMGLAFGTIFCAGTPVARAEETRIRVELSIGRVRVLSVSVVGKYKVSGTAIHGGVLTVRTADNGVTVTHSELGRIGAGKSVTIEREALPDDYATLTFKNSRYGDCSYLGDVVFSKDDKGFLRAVNHVSMRHYQYGVVGGELRESYPAEALKAQAIAAKGYGLAYIGSDRDADLGDTATHQVYKGYHPENSAVIQAVNAVEGETLLYGGKPVKCFYCTSNGGQTLTPYMRWGGHGYDGIYEMRFDPYDLAGSDGAVVTEVSADPATLSEPLYAYFLRLAKAADGSVRAIERIDGLTGYCSADSREGTARRPNARAPQERAEIAMTCRTAAGTTTQIAAEFVLYALKSEGVIAVGAADTWLIHEAAPGSWQIVFAKSSGHRVGMSHRGMREMARQGFTYEDILRFYYPGATLTRAN